MRSPWANGVPSLMLREVHTRRMKQEKVMEQSCILVIEDSTETQRRLAERVLEPNGYRCLAAMEGTVGLEMAVEKHPDLIITDLQLPDMNGFEVLENLRDQGLDTPVIFMSTHQSTNQVTRAFRLGACDYIAKPFEPEEMLTAIQRAVADAHSREKQKQLTQQIREANTRLGRQLQELNTLYAIGRSVTSVLNLDHVLNRIVEAAVYMADAEEGMLLLLDDTSHELHLRAAKDLGDRWARTLRMRVDDSIAGRALRTGKPVQISGEKAKVVTGYLVEALLYIPLRVPGRGAIGVLGVTHRETERLFSKRDVFLLSALADYAAIAVENARLFKDIAAERTKLEAVLREANEPIIVADEENNILLCNAAARAALELSDVDMSSQSVDKALSHPDVREVFSYGHERARSVHREVTLDDDRTFNAQLTPIKDVGRVLIMQDITHLKELDRIKSEFVTTVSHDLRTP